MEGVAGDRGEEVGRSGGFLWGGGRLFEKWEELMIPFVHLRLLKCVRPIGREHTARYHRHCMRLGLIRPSSPDW